jgi:peroxiredoxin
MQTKSDVVRPRSDRATAFGNQIVTQHAYAAFVSDRSQDFEPLRWLPRGTVVDLPFLDSIEDLPIDLALHCQGRRTVLLFYPGGWEAASNTVLRAFQAQAARFEAASVALVAVTPELPQFARQTSERNHLSFAVAVDHACRFTRSLGCSFKLPVPLRRIVRDHGLRLNIWNGEGSYNLPMPVVLLLDKDRRVRWIDTAHAVDALDPDRVLRAVTHLGPDE